MYRKNRKQAPKVRWSRVTYIHLCWLKLGGKCISNEKGVCLVELIYLPGCSKLKGKQTHFRELHLLPLGG